MKHFLDLYLDSQPDIFTLLCLVELVLSLNCFSFAVGFYQHISRVGMERQGTILRVFQRFHSKSSTTYIFLNLLHCFFKRAHNPRDHLVHSFFLNPISAAPALLLNTTILTGTHCRPYNITEYFTCNSSDVICCISCSLYILVHQSNQVLLDLRLAEHLRDTTIGNDTPISRHFCSTGHLSSDCPCPGAIRIPASTSSKN